MVTYVYQSETHVLEKLKSIYKEGKVAYTSSCYKHCITMGACMPYGITQSYLSPARGSTPALTPTVSGWYSIYPPIKDGRLSRPEPTLDTCPCRVATDVPAISDVSCLSLPFASLGTVVVNN